MPQIALLYIPPRSQPYAPCKKGLCSPSEYLVITILYFLDNRLNKALDFSDRQIALSLKVKSRQSLGESLSVRRSLAPMCIKHPEHRGDIGSSRLTEDLEGPGFDGRSRGGYQRVASS